MMSCPAHRANEVSCGLGGVVQWPCSMCVQYSHEGAVFYLWDGLRAFGGLAAPD